MGEELRDVRLITIGDTQFDISGVPEITEFTCEEEPLKEYIEEQFRIQCFKDSEFSCTVQLNLITMLKLMGFWNWVLENCPNRRVKHLMQNHKDDRVKIKNYRHALKLIGKILEERR